MATNNKNFRVKNGLDVNGEINVSAVGGDEGGQINLEKPATGTTLSGNVSIDVYQNKIRIFDAGGTNKGAYIDLTAATDGVGSNLLAGGGGGISNVVEDTTPQLGGDLDAQGYDITNLNSVTLDTTPTSPGTAAGTIYWDDGDGVPKAILNANVTVGVNQELILKVKNATGSTITKGSVVYINGAQGQNPTVALADADTEITSSKTFGFAAEEIIDTAEGFVITQGVLRGVNTDGFTEGGAIWLSSTAGQYTQTIPEEPAHAVFLGYAVKAHASAGEVIVKIQNGYELTELHGVTIEETLADNEVLAYNEGTGLWINQTAAEAGLSVVGHTHSLTDVTDVTASAAELNILDGATLSTTELNYVDGVTSAIQTQINGKANTSHTHSGSDITSGTVAVANGGTGATTATDARTNLETPKVYSQGTEPAGGNIGDIWIDTDSTPAQATTFARFEASKTTSQSIADATTEVVGFPVGVENAGGFTTTTDADGGLIITIPKTGRYSIAAYIDWQQNGINKREVRILRNGSIIWANTGEATSEAGGFRQFISVPSYRLTAADTISVQVRQDAGSATNVDLGTIILEYLGE